uniref:NADH-ubiquinone oxidoreductase chain 4L n=1 Tax=Peltodytes quadratus TaxID=1050041 RepID=S4SWP0_9COLE|nr:NADH dehydrogenase subunit 4L [Peltodytes quadratus]
MLNFMTIIFLIMFIMGLLSFSLNRKHLLLMLLSLEFIILSLYMLLYMYLLMYMYEYYFSMMFLVFCVCESVLGLSVLISLIRVQGNDYFLSMNMLC